MDYNNEDVRNTKELVAWLKDYFANSIDDENIRSFILNGSNYKKKLDKTGSYVQYIENTINLSFIFLYGRFRLVRDTSNKADLSDVFDFHDHNAARVVNSLQNTFVEYALTSELIQFVFTDLQFDMKNGQNSLLKKYFSPVCAFKSEEFNLIKYFKLISGWKSNASRFSYSIDDAVEMFCLLLNEMSFLKNYNLIKDGEMYVFKRKGNIDFISLKTHPEYVPTFRVLIDDEDYLGFYTLNNVERDFTGEKLSLRYSSTDGFNYLNYCVAEYQPESDCDRWIKRDPNEYFNELTGYPFDYKFGGEEEYNDTLISQIHTINYKYIKNLALAISDAVSSNAGTKDVLYSAFSNYSDIFGMPDDRNGQTDLKFDWDSVIVMLLIEAGPTAVLETLIRANMQMYIDIAKNLSNRLCDPEMALSGLSDDELTEKVYDFIRNHLFVGDSFGFGRKSGKFSVAKNNRKLYARAAARVIMYALNSCVEDSSDTKQICAGNVYDNIKVLSEIKKSSTEEKIRYVSIILGETFKYLICFYSGVIKYGEQKVDFDIVSNERCLSKNDIAPYQEGLHNAFFKAAQDRSEELKKYNTEDPECAIELMKLFVEFCKENKSSKDLYRALGKHEILNLSDFNECRRKYDVVSSTINEENVNNWIEFSRNLLEYFKSGSFGDTPIDYNLFNAVYPFVTTYHGEHENYDGYHTGIYAIRIDVDNDGRSDFNRDINVLSEFSYNLCEDFYCLPNIQRSNKKWWIDPLLISYVEFNNIFRS